MTRRSIVYKSQLWSILEYHDARLRNLIFSQIDKISLKYKILRNNDIEAKNDKVCLFAMRLDEVSIRF